MPVEARLLLALAAAALVTWALTPMAARLARRLRFFDAPAGYKGHAAPTPYLGGLAVAGGFLVALLLGGAPVDAGSTATLAGAALVLWAVGTVDDRRTVSPGVRVAVEAVLAAGLWAAGLGWSVGAGGALDLVLTVAWVVAVVNAFNLFDNMDGAASTIAFVVCAGTATLAALAGDAWIAVAGGALAGACLGFLPHNAASPARIFLGDGGSMPVGLVAATVAMTAASEAAPGVQAIAVGVLLTGVPLVDTALVITSRRRRGISILTGGRDHLTHRTRRHLGTPLRVSLALGGVQALLCAGAVATGRGGSSALALVAAAYLVVGAAAIVAFLAEERRLEAPAAAPQSE